MKINIAGFVEDSIVDGPGLRTTLFVQGCPHNCKGCHNAQTHAFGEGQDKTVEELYEMIKTSSSSKLVTFSGGEPFCQAEGLSLLGEKLKSDGFSIAVYSGYTFEQLIKANSPHINKLLSICDILIDGKFILEQKSLEVRFRGSKNQRILNLKESLRLKMAVETTDSAWIGGEKFDAFAPRKINYGFSKLSHIN